MYQKEGGTSDEVSVKILSHSWLQATQNDEKTT